MAHVTIRGDREFGLLDKRVKHKGPTDADVQSVRLIDCSYIPERLVALKFLQELELCSCSALTSLPDCITELTSLVNLKVRDCSGLVSLPDKIGALVELQTLHLADNDRLSSLPDSIKQLTKLTKLDLEGSYSLRSLPAHTGAIKGLCELNLSGCKSLRSLPDSIAQLTGLTKMLLKGCSSLQNIPDGLGALVKLQHLSLNGCTQLRSLPDSITQLVVLALLDLGQCSSLQSLPDGLGGLAKLRVLLLGNCKQLDCLPDSIEQLSELTRLDLSESAAMCSLPDDIPFDNLEEPWDQPALQFSMLASPPIVVADLTMLQVFTSDVHHLEREPCTVAEMEPMRTFAPGTRRACAGMQSAIFEAQVDRRQRMARGTASNDAACVIASLIRLCQAWALAMEVSEEVGDIMYVLCYAGKEAPQDLQQQRDRWGEVAERLRKGDVDAALGSAQRAAAWLHQELQRVDCHTAATLGFQDVQECLKTISATNAPGPAPAAIKQQALRIYKNISNISKEEHHQAGMQELELVIYQLIEDAQAISIAFARSWTSQQSATQQPVAGPGPICEAVEQHGPVMMQSVFFVTDRALNQDAYQNAQHASTFGKQQQADVQYGMAKVRIPQDRSQDLTVSALADVDVFFEGRDAFLERLRADLAAPDSNGELVLFIHGYNVDFKGAVTSAGQLTFDTSPYAASREPPYRTAVVFDWACCKEPLGYFKDKERAQESSGKLLTLLGDILELCPQLGLDATAQFPLQAVHIIPHSMGNRVLQRALDTDHLRHDAAAVDMRMYHVQKVLQGFAARCNKWSITFAAADARRSLFTAMLEQLCVLQNRPTLTLYSSNRDYALLISSLLRSSIDDDRTGRAGFYMWHPVLAKRHKFHVMMHRDLDTVTVTGGVSQRWFGHGYHRGNERVLQDLQCIMLNVAVQGLPAAMSPEVEGCNDCRPLAQVAPQKPRNIYL